VSESRDLNWLPAEQPPGAASPTVPSWPLSTLPAAGAEYHHFLRTPKARWWQGLLLILTFVVLYLTLTLVLSVAAIAFDVATGRLDAGSLTQGRVALTVTPALLLATNLAPALMIPASLMLQWGFFGQRPRWMHSVQGAFRWRLLARAAVFIVPLWAVYVVAVTLAFPPAGNGRFTSESVALLVVILLTTPLQAAGEEYGARGLLTRAAGSWAADPRLALLLGTVLSATVFTVAHGAGDPWLIVYYFVFAVSLSIVTWRTGGLELAVLIHGVNNVFLFVLSVSLGADMSQAFNRQNGVGGPSMLVAMAMMVLVAALVWVWAARQGVTRHADQATLAGPGE
jgi:membrane protease YdiL (CAAX protease family)